MSGTWNSLTNLPASGVETTFLLTDGSVLAHGTSTNHWYRLTPASDGSYQNGTWAQIADSVNGALYYASGILRDGRLIIVGGEYNFGAAVWLNAAEIYDPVANAWTTLPTPAGWVRIGDAPGCVLPDGRFFVGQVSSRRTAIYDPATNAWSAAADKLAFVGEESWSLLPDGTIHAVDCSNRPNAEKYIIASNQWVAAGSTPETLVDSISEIGASVLLPDGRLFVIGATGHTCIYTFPAVANMPGTWASGPNIPEVNVGEALGAVDAPAVVLPNGRVLFSAGPITTPASFQAPTYFFEFDPTDNTIASVARPANSNGLPYMGRLLMLPNGQAMHTRGSTEVDLYTPDGAADPFWRPSITGCPGTARPGNTYTLHGRQINGLTQCVYYGNDATQATNYPIVRLESTSDARVIYCRTSNFSTMGLQTGTVVHSCSFKIPAGTLGHFRLTVIANGIASESRDINISNKIFKELKYEIKEKLEFAEVNKRILDNYQKRVPDIVDQKMIREQVEDFGRMQDDWLLGVRRWAEQFDAEQVKLGRAFIKPEERPDLAEPAKAPPILPRKISNAEAVKATRKLAFADGRIGQFSRQAEKFRIEVHSLVERSGKQTQGGRRKGPEGGKPRGKGKSR